MTDEEKAKEWVRTNSGYSTKEFHGKKAIEAFLAGLEAGKSLAETDLATTAYMLGAERYKTKWHKVTDGNLPKENKLYLVEIKDNGLAIAYFNGRHWETRYNLGDSGHCVEVVIAWCEIPTFTDKE